MYKTTKAPKTVIKRNTSYVGERLEEKIMRIVNNKEPITDGAPLIYTDRSEGVLPAYDIRTDRFEIAVEAMDKVAKAHAAKRAENIKAFQEKLDEKNGVKKGDEKGNEAGGQSTQATDSK